MADFNMFLHDLFLLGGIGFWVLLAVEFVFLITCLEWERHVLAPISLLLTFFLVTQYGCEPGFHFQYLEFLKSIFTLQGGIYIIAYFFLGTLYCIGKWWLYVKDQKRKFNERRHSWYKQNLPVLASDFEHEIKQWFYASNSIDDNIQRLYNYLSRYKLPIADKVKLIDKTDRVAASTAGNEILLDLSKQIKEVTSQPYDPKMPFNNANVETIWNYNVYSNSIKGKPDPANHKLLIYSWIAYWPISGIWSIINDPIRHFCVHIYNSIAGLLYKIADNAWKD